MKLTRVNKAQQLNEGLMHSRTMQYLTLMEERQEQITVLVRLCSLVRGSPQGSPEVGSLAAESDIDRQLAAQLEPLSKIKPPGRFSTCGEKSCAFGRGRFLRRKLIGGPALSNGNSDPLS